MLLKHTEKTAAAGVAENWSRLHRQAVDTPFLGIFKAQLHMHDNSESTNATEQPALADSELSCKDLSR